LCVVLFDDWLWGSPVLCCSRGPREGDEALSNCLFIPRWLLALLGLPLDGLGGVSVVVVLSHVVWFGIPSWFPGLFDVLLGLSLLSAVVLVRWLCCLALCGLLLVLDFAGGWFPSIVRGGG
jgi:hypothetical protein